MSEETIDYGQVTGMVHSTESFGSVDGPGIRFIVFLQGCHMRLPVLPQPRHLGYGVQ
ncbi:pyruvate formate-lyase-activating enzyme [Streptococcus pneumoniae]|nr:pyruvate formate-lyase-activating enzyme [Streptococcus pneumoniae]